MMGRNGSTSGVARPVLEDVGRRNSQVCMGWVLERGTSADLIVHDMREAFGDEAASSWKNDSLNGRERRQTKADRATFKDQGGHVKRSGSGYRIGIWEWDCDGRTR